MKPTIEDRIYQEILENHYVHAIETLQEVSEDTEQSFYYKGRIYGFLSTPSGTIEDTYYFLNGFRYAKKSEELTSINYSTVIYLDHTIRKDTVARDELNLEKNILQSPSFLHFAKGFVDYANDICESLEFYWDLTNDSYQSITF